MGSVTYVAEDHAYLLIRMDLIVVGRHLQQYLELLTSAHGPERLVDTGSAKKKKLEDMLHSFCVEEENSCERC